MRMYILILSRRGRNVAEKARDELTLLQLEMAYDLYVSYEDRKWTSIASRIFDKRGKRVDPGLLREKLGGLGL